MINYLIFAVFREGPNHDFFIVYQKNMMKKISTFALIILSALSLPAFSNILTPEEALNRCYGNVTRSEDREFNHIFTLNSSNLQPSIYIFNNNLSGGFIVASADDCAPAILGYSTSGEFDPCNMPPELNYWLGEYSRQIGYMQKHYGTKLISRASISNSNMKAIAPLLKSKWNQGAPFNKYCYTIDTTGKETQSVTGCVATSMAQVMYYFQYPSIGHGEISYKFEDSGTYSMNFGDQSFQWNEMLPIYYPEEYSSQEEDAVAYLMKACGYSVRMDYGKGESGASGTAIAGALIDYFGYGEGIEIQTRKFRTYDEWAQMIYDNLNEIGPVVYNGDALDGGHSFVCDGYDGNGYFHFNWGWGGMSDGYYLLDVLNPDEFGIGGTAGGYNLGQQIILGISPQKTEISNPCVMQFGNVEGVINDEILTLELYGTQDTGFQYINPTPVQITFGIIIKNTTDTSQEIQYIESAKRDLEAKQGSFFHWKEVGTTLDLSKISMTQGNEYDVILATNIKTGSSTEWSETVAMPGKSNYVTIVKVPEGYKITNYPASDLSVSEFKIVSNPVYFNMPVKFSATFTNSGDEELTRNYSAILLDSNGEVCYKMENYSINVEAGATVTETWSSVQWHKENNAETITETTEYTLRLYDNWEGNYVEGIDETVTVLPERKGDNKIESSLTISGARKEGDVYVISGNQFEASLTVKVIEGFLNHTIMFAIQMPLLNGDYYTVMHKHFDAIPDLSAGEEQVMDISVIFEDAEPDKIYRIEVWGPDGGFNEKMFVKFELPDTGVHSIPRDSTGLFRIYSLDGKFISVKEDLSRLNNLPHGIYIINGKKIVL